MMPSWNYTVLAHNSILVIGPTHRVWTVIDEAGHDDEDDDEATYVQGIHHFRVTILDGLMPVLARRLNIVVSMGVYTFSRRPWDVEATSAVLIQRNSFHVSQ